MRRAIILALVACAAPAAAHAAIVIEHPEIRPTIGLQRTTAAYLTIRNTGAGADRLVGAACACAAMVMPHRTTTTNGVSAMAMETSVAGPAHGAVAFDARGRHLMLTGVKAPIRTGAKIRMILTFEKAGKVAVDFTAADLAGMDGITGHTDHNPAP